MNELAKAITKNLLKDDPFIDGRIARGIEEHRKGEGMIELTDANGVAVPNAKIKLHQIRHEFHFGCNSFMLEQFKEKEKNAAYEEAFAKVFNLAVVPFFWSDTEPEQGKPRFDRNSPYIYRRPPTDTVLEFCDKYNIIPKGHTLCWFSHVPKWASLDKNILAHQIEKRIRVIAERYGERIHIWDVCNEALTHNPLNVLKPVTRDHVEHAFKVASDCLPKSSVLTHNEGNCWGYHGEYTPLYMLSRHLKNQPQLNLGAIGMQFHQHEWKVENLRSWADGRLNPRYLFAMLDLYGTLGLPINISEITIQGRDELGDGSVYQKEVIEKLYRLWFSHPAINGIIYWNLVDGTGYVANNGSWDENPLKGGLLNFDMTPKPSYEVLSRLINEEWRTRATLAYQGDTDNRFVGFYGDYAVEIETTSGTYTRSISLTRGSINHFKRQLTQNG